MFVEKLIFGWKIKKRIKSKIILPLLFIGNYANVLFLLSLTGKLLLLINNYLSIFKKKNKKMSLTSIIFLIFIFYLRFHPIICIDSYYFRSNERQKKNRKCCMSTLSNLALSERTRDYVSSSARAIKTHRVAII